MTYSARRSKHQHLELLFYNESNSYHYGDFLLVILTIPLADQSLVMNLYKIHNLPALHPKLHVQFQYQLEGEYLAVTKDKQYAALPTARDI